MPPPSTRAVFAPPAPAQILLQHEQALRAVGMQLRDHTRALLAGMRQVWTMRDLADRWAMTEDQARAQVREYVGERPAAAGRVAIEDVLKLDERIKVSVHAQ